MGKILLFFVAVSLSSCSAKGPEFGPWDAFTYTRDGNITVRREEGRFETLNKCMHWVTMRTKRTGGSYYCGYDCKTRSGGIVRCERLAGYPI